MLSIKGLRSGYGKIEVLHDVILDIVQGQIVTLIGANGAGKTTLLKTISGLLRPGAGSISFEDKNIVRLPPHKIVGLGISHVPEGRAILKRMTVIDNLRMVTEGNQALRETVFWTPPELTAPTEADEVNSSLCHGFIFDFCGVEVDRVTGAVRVDKYVTMHDVYDFVRPTPRHTRRLPCGNRCRSRTRRYHPRPAAVQHHRDATARSVAANF